MPQRQAGKNPHTSTWLTYPLPDRASRNDRKSKKEKLLIFFIPGNPGLVGYYPAFLEHLYTLLDSVEAGLGTDVEVRVCGRSLRGFEVDDSLRFNPGTGVGELRDGVGDGVEGREWPEPLDLNGQILASEEAVFNTTRRLYLDTPADHEGRDGGQQGEEKEVKIVLIGHSVGAYIALEVLRRQRERFCAQVNSSSLGQNDGNDSNGVKNEGRQGGEARIVGVVGLTPTVVDIALSDSGRKVGSLLQITFIPALVNLLASCLTWFIPFSIFSRIVARVLKFTPAASDTTAAFVKSRRVIRNSLYLAGTEMAQITQDTWTDEIWGAATPSPSGTPRAKLRFLFSDRDHWVANKTRDDLIKRRAFTMKLEENEPEGGDENADVSKARSGKDWKPRMKIQNGLRHAFCVHQSEAVAEKVARYVQEMLQLDDKGI